MAEISIDHNYLARLIIKMRGVQAKEGVVDPDSGSNAVDDDMVDVLQDSPGDLSSRELHAEIRALDEQQQAELVALMWIGRGDGEPEEWEATVALAKDRKTGPTSDYLLRQPLVADQWAEGAEKIGVALPLS